MIALDEVVRATGGYTGAKPAFFAGVSIDSRTALQGQLFFCVKGERFDGHDFVEQAAGRGATGVVCLRGRQPEVERRVPDLAVVGVDDVRLALGRLGAARRAALGDLRVVGVTGSVGKTTTKELLAAVLAEAAGGAAHVLKTEGNLNNDLGLPLTLMRLEASHRYAVIEMGMSGLGEIDYLASLARPDVAVVTKIAPAHLLQMGSLENIAKAKGEIWSHLDARGIAVLPAGDALLLGEVARVPADRRRTFGAAGDVVVVAAEPRGVDGTDVELAIGGAHVKLRLAMVGVHNAANAAAAAAAASALGVDPATIARGLAAARPAKNRSEQVEIGPWHVIADCYNANPASSAAALDALAGMRAERAVAVLGDMLELGPSAAALHRELGRKAGGLGLTALVCVGPLAREIAAGAREVGMAAGKILETEDRAAAAARAAEAAGPGGWILVKASRGLKLEAVIDALKGAA
jgi:UDP-N-acetylmuramoyl-tripeptide--D-alanyl-D-alanine ligase